MEGLKFGWIKPRRSETYHYIPDFSGKSIFSIQSPCRKYSIQLDYAENKGFLAKFEILDTSQICHLCELKLQNKTQNNSKQEELEQFNQTSITDDYIIKEVICSEESCNEKGVAFVSSVEKQHYCIKHNLRVQETILKEKELEAIS